MEMNATCLPTDPSPELLKSTITLAETELPENTPKTSINSPTSLQKRTMEKVIKDLQDLRPLPQDDHPKRRKLNTADVNTVNSHTESSSNDYFSSDSEGEPDGKPVRPLKISQRKRVMNATVDDYVRQRNIDEVRKGAYVRPEDEHKQSVRWLVNQSENRNIISTPREYQIELFERAKEKNIIAVLDTGNRPYSPWAWLSLVLTLSQELARR
jgi:endoribonuclease Dicer